MEKMTFGQYPVCLSFFMVLRSLGYAKMPDIPGLANQNWHTRNDVIAHGTGNAVQTFLPRLAMLKGPESQCVRTTIMSEYARALLGFTPVILGIELVLNCCLNVYTTKTVHL